MRENGEQFLQNDMQVQLIEARKIFSFILFGLIEHNEPNPKICINVPTC